MTNSNRLLTKASKEEFVFFLSSIFLPWLTITYPATFYYLNNFALVPFKSFVQLFFLLGSISAIVFLFIRFVLKTAWAQASLGASISMVAFLAYGSILEKAQAIDIIPIQTYNFLPFYLVLVFTITWSATYIKASIARKLVQSFILVVLILVMVNVSSATVKFLRTQKGLLEGNTPDAQTPTIKNIIDQKKETYYPDIYYLIFDEAASFDVVREYFQYPEVNAYVKAYKDIGFIIFEDSRAESIYTLHEIATRLNYQTFPVGSDYSSLYDGAIGSNRVVDFLKQRGYSIIAFDERRTKFPNDAAFPADVLIETSPENIGENFVYLDDYKLLVLKSTIVREWIDSDPSVLIHRNFLVYTTENIASEIGVNKPSSLIDY